MKKRILFLLLISLTITALAGAEIKFTLLPESPRRGEPVTIALDTYATEAFLFVGGNQAAKGAVYHVEDTVGVPCYFAAILTIPSTVAAGRAIIRINNERGQILEIPFTIAARTFRQETIELTPALTTLVTTRNERTIAEANRLWQILITTGNQVYHYGPFVAPIATTRRTSQFGTRRVNQYSDGRRVTSIHMGIDYGAPTGTEVYACGSGKVILARERVITGNSVVIEHAPGLYSLYYHLDIITAKENAIVEAGEIIGTVGSTGFSTGPHLHWEIRLNTENTDPDAFVARPLIDKKQIISRLFNIVEANLPEVEGGD